MDSPAHPGEYFPRASGMRFRYDPSRPKFDVVTAIELGDLDRGYKAIDITGKDARLYSLTCPLYVGLIIVAIPSTPRASWRWCPRTRRGQPLTSRVDALECPRDSTPDLLPPPGTIDASSVATRPGRGAVREIKEWQAIMDHLRSLPLRDAGRTASGPGGCARHRSARDQGRMNAESPQPIRNFRSPMSRNSLRPLSLPLIALLVAAASACTAPPPAATAPPADNVLPRPQPPFNGQDRPHGRRVDARLPEARSRRPRARRTSCSS